MALLNSTVNQEEEKWNFNIMQPQGNIWRPVSQVSQPEESVKCSCLFKMNFKENCVKEIRMRPEKKSSSKRVLAMKGKSEYGC